MYYEFKEPYYALVKAEGYYVDQPNPTERKYVQIYEEHISKLEGLTDTMKFRRAKGKQISEEEAFCKFFSSLSDIKFEDAK